MSSRRKGKPKPAASYAKMLDEFTGQCWLCGITRRPSWWNAPWVLHRAHIVHSPRVEDRRAVVLLCPVCHGAHHHIRFANAPNAFKAELRTLLYIKKQRDPAYWDREWLQAHCVGRLPNAIDPGDFFKWRKS